MSNRHSQKSTPSLDDSNTVCVDKLYAISVFQFSIMDLVQEPSGQVSFSGVVHIPRNNAMEEIEQCVLRVVGCYG